MTEEENKVIALLKKYGLIDDKFDGPHDILKRDLLRKFRVMLKAEKLKRDQ